MKALYYEDDFMFEVEILKDESNETEESYELKIIKIIHESRMYKPSEVGDIFSVWGKRKGGYYGMWRLEKIEERKIK